MRSILRQIDRNLVTSLGLARKAYSRLPNRDSPSRFICPSCRALLSSHKGEVIEQTRGFRSSASRLQERPSHDTLLAPARTADDPALPHLRLASFTQLDYESDLVQADNGQRRLIDDPSYRNNVNFLASLLQFRRRIYGKEGTRTIWHGIQRREIFVPMTGEAGSYLWEAFLQLGFRDDLILQQLYQRAVLTFKDLPEAWRSFYEAIIGHFLATSPTTAYQWHKRLETQGPLASDNLSRLAKIAFRTTDSSRIFRHIYLDSRARDLYSAIVPHLCAEEQFDVAYRWHKLLLDHGDLPSSSDVVEPLMNYLSLYGQVPQLETVTRGLIDVGVPFASSTSKFIQAPSMSSSELISRAFGETFSIPPKPYNDDFCARLFATTSFSVNMIISGMQMLGVERIGPKALRELAVRDVNPEAILQRIRRLQHAQISIGSSKFSRLIEHCASEGKQDLLVALLTGDQHPDTYEDQDLQESLLASYIQAEDWRSVDTSLAILTSFTNQPNVERWNLVLRAHLSLRNLDACKKTMDDMRLASVVVTFRSRRTLLQTILRARRPGKNPKTTSEVPDDLGFVTRILMSVMEAGTTIGPFTWKEILRRLGQTGRLDELERLSLWLALYYNPTLAGPLETSLAPRRMSAMPGRPALGVPKTISSSHPSHPLRILFPPSFQRAVIAWGFLDPVLRTESPSRTLLHEQASNTQAHRPWTRGLLLLKALRARGVYVETAVVRKAYQQRLRILYGPGRSKVPRNHRARKLNDVPLRVMMEDARHVWGRKLLQGLSIPPPPRSLSPAEGVGPPHIA